METVQPQRRRLAPAGSELLEWLCRLALALVFFYAAWEKIVNPSGFAQSIDNYRLFPLWSVGPLAVFLPWLEMWAAILLFFNKWKQAAALILGLMLIAFMVSVGFNLSRGLDFECGCFGAGGRRAGTKLLIQDSLLLVCAAVIFFRKAPRK